LTVAFDGSFEELPEEDEPAQIDKEDSSSPSFSDPEGSNPLPDPLPDKDGGVDDGGNEPAVGPIEPKVLEDLFGWLSDPVRDLKEFTILRHE
jgi:hypothetical protein